MPTNKKFTKSKARQNTFTSQGWKVATSETTNKEVNKARDFIKEEWLTTKDAVNKYVVDNFDWDADAFFNNFSSTEEKVDSWTETWNDAIDETVKAKEDNEALQEELQQKQKENLEQAKDDKKTDLTRTNKTAEENERIIKRQAQEAQALEDERRERFNDEKAQELELLKEKEANAKKQTEADRKKLDAQAEYQRQQNEQAIVEAKSNIEIERQQSAWAYQKLWLGFSSGIINQSQQIATDGIAKIAEIRAKMNYQESLIGVEHIKINAKMKDVELQYAGLINDTISKYSDKLDDLDESSLARMQKVEKNLLLNNQQKREKQDQILKDHRKETQNFERQHMEDMMKIKDRGLRFTKDIQDMVRQEETIARDKVDFSIESGGWFNMSEIQKEKMLRQAGLTPADGVSIEKKIIGETITIKTEQIAPKNFSLDGDSKLKIRNEVDNMLDSWYTLDEATEKAVNKIVPQTEQYKELKQTEKDMRKLSKKQLEAKIVELENNKEIAPLEKDARIAELKNAIEIAPLKQKLSKKQIENALAPKSVVTSSTWEKKTIEETIEHNDWSIHILYTDWTLELAVDERGVPLVHRYSRYNTGWEEGSSIKSNSMKAGEFNFDKFIESTQNKGGTISIDTMPPIK